jgi:ABC-2 type transport system permease protein
MKTINSISLVALYTIIRREMFRMLRIAGQVFLPPVITMSLYFLIFGRLIGPRIGEIQGIAYPQYIAPGLIMMSVIMNAYANVSSSFYSIRFQKNVEELLVSPVPYGFIMLGYVLGGVIRGFIVAFLVTLVTLYFIPLKIMHPIVTLLTISLVAIFFALLGFTNAIFAKNFDQIMIIPTFIITPLTYLGGVFYSIDMLPPFFQLVSKLNPILYMVNAFRYGLLGISDISPYIALSVLILCITVFVFINLSLLNKGVGLKE